MVDRLVAWVKGWPIVSIEDGVAEDDWEYWPVLRQALSGKALTLGDDLLCTNVVRLQKAIANKAANALLFDKSSEHGVVNLTASKVTGMNPN